MKEPQGVVRCQNRTSFIIGPKRLRCFTITVTLYYYTLPTKICPINTESSASSGVSRRCLAEIKTQQYSNHGRRPHVVVRGSNLGIADLWSRQQAKNFVGLQTSNANPSSVSGWMPSSSRPTTSNTNRCFAVSHLPVIGAFYFFTEQD